MLAHAMAGRVFDVPGPVQITLRRVGGLFTASIILTIMPLRAAVRFMLTELKGRSNTGDVDGG